MNSQSPSAAVKEIEGQVRLILRSVDLSKLGTKASVFIADLRQALIDARIYTTDYELSEIRDEQMKNAKIARRHLNSARKNLLSTSEYGLFSAIDVAHLSARIDQVIGDLK